MATESMLLTVLGHDDDATDDDKDSIRSSWCCNYKY